MKRVSIKLSPNERSLDRNKREAVNLNRYLKKRFTKNNDFNLEKSIYSPSFASYKYNQYERKKKSIIMFNKLINTIKKLVESK